MEENSEQTHRAQSPDVESAGNESLEDIFETVEEKGMKAKYQNRTEFASLTCIFFSDTTQVGCE